MLIGILLVVLIVLLLVALLLYKISTEDGKYRQPSGSSNRMKIGSLEWDIRNPSTLTYPDLGYMGRMGNQMFEIAATIAIAYQNKCRLTFPSYLRELPLESLFDLTNWPIEDVYCDHYIYEFDNYENITIPSDGKVYGLKGYRQSYWYFQDIREHLPSIFPLKCASAPEHYIAVHIRRTDYLKSYPVLRMLNIYDKPLTCSLEYYRAAIARIREESALPVIICTDDRAWCKEHIDEIDANAILNPDQSEHADFLCMYNADYLVIPNSTYSLWAGLLGNHRMVIAPSTWGMDDTILPRVLKAHQQAICPSDWAYNHPVSGQKIEDAYNWSPDKWSVQNPIARTFRAVVMSNMCGINQWLS